MDITLKNAQVQSSLEALERINQNDSLPIKLSYAASKNIKRLEKEAEDLDEFKMELLHQVAEFDEATGMIKTVEDDDGNPTSQIKFKSDEDMDRYVRHMNELYEDDVTLSLHVVDIDKVADVWIQPQLVFALEWMFKE